MNILALENVYDSAKEEEKKSFKFKNSFVDLLSKYFTRSPSFVYYIIAYIPYRNAFLSFFFANMHLFNQRKCDTQ